MSVFHRVDDMDDLPAALFFPRMYRLPLFDGAVRFALMNEARDEQVTRRPQPADSPQPAMTAYSRDDLAALNNTKPYGPMGVNQAGVFDLG
ncbi:hypothetical protein [Amycolatopsis sp. NPDC004625]|uniref:hypothetical protein n=1 Tax=Amycolatopsis sp. NPDC004625 TaxID=3154670 RepID=UPI0033BD3FEA